MKKLEVFRSFLIPGIFWALILLYYFKDSRNHWAFLVWMIGSFSLVFCSFVAFLLYYMTSKTYFLILNIFVSCVMAILVLGSYSTVIDYICTGSIFLSISVIGRMILRKKHKIKNSKN